MAIAVSDDAIGAFEEKSIVRNPFILSPNLPMFAAPDDVFTMTTTVTNMQEGSGSALPITLTLSSSENLSLNKKNIKIRLDEHADTTLSFDVQVKKQPGAAFVNMKASSQLDSSAIKSYLSVRPAIPYRTSLNSGVLRNQKADVKTDRNMYKDYRVLESTVSFLPLGLSKGLLSFLDAFPYGCTEQVLSQAFPYLYLNPGEGFEINPQKKIDKVRYALKVLSSRQYSNGKFGVWAANSHTSDFITVYGAHFITESKRFNIPVSKSLNDRTLSALKNIVKENTTEMHKLRIQAYAAYILTRHQIVTTQYLTKIVMALKKDHDGWKEDITGAYIAACYMLLKKEKEALSLFKKTSGGELQDSGSGWEFFNKQIGYSQLLYLMSMHFPELLKSNSANSISKVAAYLEANDYNTVSSSFAIMGFAEYAKAAGDVQSGKVTLTQHLPDNKEEVLMVPDVTFPTVNFSEPGRKAHNCQQRKNPPLLPGGTGQDSTANCPQRGVSQGLELYREFTDKSGKKLSEIKLGDEILVHLKFRSLADITLHNIAIVDLLPAGLEAVPTSIRDKTKGNWQPEFVDIREDRLVLFGNVPEKLQQFVYTVRAVNKGKYTVPPLYGESMYDNNLYGVSPQSPIVIK